MPTVWAALLYTIEWSALFYYLVSGGLCVSELNTIVSGIASGALVGIGGAVYLSCDNKYVGAVLFSVALISICYLGLYLFTGKIGFVAEEFKKSMLWQLPLGLLGNFIGATCLGYLISFAKPSLRQAAASACASKLENGFMQTLVLGAMCGVLMYIAVKIFKSGNNPIGIIFGIPVFILSGYEHSIADMFYFALANMLTPHYLIFITAVVLGNAVGAAAMAVIVRFSIEKSIGNK